MKPPELQSLIENFCLGTRRLHLYGSKNALRRGWLTVNTPESLLEEFGKDSKVQQVENEEETSQSQSQRWEAKEWERDVWEARWKKTTGEQQGNEEGSSSENGEKVATLLPYIEGTGFTHLNSTSFDS